MNLHLVLGELKLWMKIQQRFGKLLWLGKLEVREKLGMGFGEP